jgi:hypothetical protein
MYAECDCRLPIGDTTRRPNRANAGGSRQTPPTSVVAGHRHRHDRPVNRDNPRRPEARVRLTRGWYDER